MILFFIGLFIGSFLNVLIDRLSKNESILGRSHCENCKKTLSLFDLIPLVSFALLKGRCRYCHAKLSWQYPAIEVSTGILFALAYVVTLKSGFLYIDLIFYIFIFSILLIVFMTDIKYGLILDKIVFPSVLITAIWLLVAHPTLALNHFLAAICSFLFFLFIFLLTRGRGMGFGDVKLAFLLGLILGFPLTIVSLYISFLTGGIFGLILILWKRKLLLKLAVPFGPFLVLGCFVSIFFQDLILQKLTLLF